VKIVLGPDVFANASVAPGTDPDKVVQRTLGGKARQVSVTPWILDTIRFLLDKVPAFKHEALDKHIELIRSLVTVLDETEKHAPAAWGPALAAAARLAGTKTVVTDHPDLINKTEAGIDFISTENFLVEVSLPPPPPPIPGGTK
jgi:hypothetical protein